MTMNTRTRYVLLGGAGVMAVGLAGGLAAWVSSGLPSRVLAQERPDELRYVPPEATVLSFADVRGVMDSDLRRRVRETWPELDGQREFQQQTGIDIERDIDYVVAGLVPDGDASNRWSGVAILAGRFDEERLEALALEHGGAASDHRGRRLLTHAEGPVAMAFLEPGVAAIGSLSLVRRTIDLPAAGRGVDSNDSLMGLLDHVDRDSTAWAVGRLDDAAGGAWLPDQMAAADVAAFALGSRVNGGVSGTLTAEARDEETGRNLRDLLQGFLALARLQAGSRPELAGLLDSIRLTSAGPNVTLGFDLPADAVLELLPEPSGGDAASAP